MIFKDREEAGRLLAQALKENIRKDLNPIILAIPRGGVPVAYAMAQELSIPVSLVITRKLGLPWNEEAGFGAIDPEGRIYLDEEIVGHAKLDSSTVSKIAQRELQKIREREETFLPKGYPNLKDRHAVVVDDGVATGYTAIAGAEFAKRKGASRVTVAVPVCPEDSVKRISETVDDFVCYHPSREMNFAVGLFYQDFHQLSDDEVLEYIFRLKEKGLFEPS